MKRLRNLLQTDHILTGAVILLNLIGLLAVSNVAEVSGRTMLIRQGAGSAVGLLMLFAMSFVDFKKILAYEKWLYGITIVLLVLVLIAGVTVGGAKRWVGIGSFVFQPSEMAKILLILFFSAFIMNYRERFPGYKIYLMSAVLMLIPVAMIILEPDLSTSIMITLIFLVIIFTAGISWKIIAAAAAAVIPVSALLLYLAVNDRLTFLSEYQQNRVQAWLHPEEYLSTTAYQTMNSMMAIGSGGILGKGMALEEGSLFRTGFISESQTDFIFAVIGEEFGFIGCVCVVFLITVISVRCFVIASQCRNMSGRIIAAGMGAWISLQSFLNIGVTTGLLPNTGIPLPFVSYGLTALLCLYTGLGIVQNIHLSNRKNVTKTQDEDLWEE